MHGQSPRIAVVAAVLHPRYGGPASVIRQHVSWLSGRGEVSVAGVAERADQEELRSLYPGVRLSPLGFPRRWGHGTGLARELRSLAPEVDLFHAHMLWDHPVYAAWQASSSLGKGLVITPHGSLLGAHRWRALHKRTYRRLLLDRILRGTACLHALNAPEADACREYGITAPIRVIPNALPSAAFAASCDPAPARRHIPQMEGKRVLLYLGRLWRGKGLDLLLEAWAAARPSSEWVLVIAGPDYRGYRVELERLVRIWRLADSVVLRGHVAEPLNRSLLASAACVVLPSREEAFSMTILEAMAARVPVLFTTRCHFRELHARGGGWEIPAERDPLVASLQDIFTKDPAALRQAGQNAWDLGREKYTMDTVGPQLLAMYRDVLSGEIYR
jgi:glycosyltransferase involved in cell wall biosynthesis